MTQQNETLDAAAVESIRSAYDTLAITYDCRWRRYTDRSLAKVMGILSLQGGERVLDVGCGTGELERRLLSRWPQLHVTGVDLSPNMLAQARKKQLTGDVTWREGEVSQLPVPDQQFDLLICANSFHYFRSPLDCLREFRRTLIPNGKLVLVDWCDDYLLCKLCGYWLTWTDPAFFGAYTMTACREMMREAGFDVAHSERFKVGWLWGMMMIVCTA